MNRKYVIAAVLALAASFAFGRFTAPARVEVKKEIVTVEVEKKSTQKDQSVDQNKKTTEIELTRPDGTKIKKKVTQSEKQTNTQVDQLVEHAAKTQETESKVIETASRLTVSLIAGPNFTDFKAPLTYGCHISRPFFGPVTLGVWGLSSGQGGISLGLQF
jgi:hypothetical protein